MKRTISAALVLLGLSTLLGATELIVTISTGCRHPGEPYQVWKTYLQYERGRSCNCFYWDSYQKNPKFIPIEDKTLIKKLLERSKEELERGPGISNKLIFLMFRYKHYDHVFFDLSLRDLHLSLGQKEICMAVVPLDVPTMMVFDQDLKLQATFGG